MTGGFSTETFVVSVTKLYGFDLAFQTWPESANSIGVTDHTFLVTEQSKKSHGAGHKTHMTLFFKQFGGVSKDGETSKPSMALSRKHCKGGSQKFDFWSCKRNKAVVN